MTELSINSQFSSTCIVPKAKKNKQLITIVLAVSVCLMLGYIMLICIHSEVSDMG